MTDSVQIVDAKPPTRRQPDQASCADEPRNWWLAVPNEILLFIFEELSTIEGIWSLACASQRHWHTFNHNAVRILEAVIPIHTHEFIQNAMHATFNIKACHPKRYRYRQLRHLDYLHKAHERRGLMRAVTPEFTRRFLTLARKIHALAHLILDNCNWDVFNVCEKFRPVGFDKGRAHLSNYIDSDFHKGEEARTIMALWLCELHNSLYVAARTDNPPWVRTTLRGVPPENRSLPRFFRGNWSGPILTVWHGIHLMKSPKEPPGRARWPNELWPVIMDIPPLPRGSLEFGLRCRTEWPNFAAPDWANDHDTHMTILRLMWQAPLALQFFSGLRSVGPEGSDIFRLPFAYFIRFGVFNWDVKKLVKLSLLPNDEQISRDELFEYWKSLLPDSVVSAAVEAQKEDKRRYWDQIRLLRAQDRPEPQVEDDFVYRDYDASEARTGSDESDESTTAEEE